MPECISKHTYTRLGVVVHVCYPSAGEAEAGGLLDLAESLSSSSKKCSVPTNEVENAYRRHLMLSSGLCTQPMFTWVRGQLSTEEGMQWERPKRWEWRLFPIRMLCPRKISEVQQAGP